MNKFEQLLDYIVNEEKEKAEELFHEIVVEKSRDIYENLIAEETAEDETAEEAVEEEAEESEDDESVEEAFGMDDEGGEEPAIGGDATDDLAGDVEDPEAADEFGGEEGEGDTTPATRGDVQDLEDALDELKAEFERLMGEVDTDGDGDHDMADHEAGEEESDEEESGEEDEEGANPFEGRTMTREYRETVGKPSNTEAGDGKAGPINANPKDRPSSGATAKNIAQSKSEAGGIKGGEGLVGGKKGEFTSSNTHNVNNVKSGVKTLSKVAGGHGAEKKGGGESAGNTKSIVDHKIG